MLNNFKESKFKMHRNLITMHLDMNFIKHPILYNHHFLDFFILNGDVATITINIVKKHIDVAPEVIV